MRIADIRPGRRRRPAQDEQPPAGAVEDVRGRVFRPGPRHAAAQPREFSTLLSAPPVQADPGAAHVTVPPRPAFEAKPSRPSASTAPHPVAVARPYAPAASAPAPAETAGEPMTLQWIGAAEAGERESTGLLYAGPGWAGHLMRLRVTDGEWDDVQEIAEQGLGRNAADMASGLRRTHAKIAERVLQQCAAIGRPELAGVLLRRANEFTKAAREVAGAGAR